jgi:hypothetical protein
MPELSDRRRILVNASERSAERNARQRQKKQTPFTTSPGQWWTPSFFTGLYRGLTVVSSDGVDGFASVL